LPLQDDCAIYEEVAIMASLKHPHIVPIIDFFEEPECYFIIMELMAGGDLFDRIGKKKSYSEADARDLVIKMLKAVAICHQKNIAHCDMKPKNLLLVSENDDSFIKLADFGFAARVHQPKSLTKQCGTPFFVAPEILIRRPYDQQSDMWSVGCIVYLLLSGNLPFLGRSQKELFRKIISGRYDFKEEIWNQTYVLPPKKLFYILGLKYQQLGSVRQTC
jgi:calcium/calmodulin-dependent protein kinase I